jgi:hypothetical protein
MYTSVLVSIHDVSLRIRTRNQEGAMSCTAVHRTSYPSGHSTVICIVSSLTKKAIEALITRCFLGYLTMLFQLRLFYGVVWKDVDDDTRDPLECTLWVLARETEGNHENLRQDTLSSG